MKKAAPKKVVVRKKAAPVPVAVAAEPPHVCPVPSLPSHIAELIELCRRSASGEARVSDEIRYRQIGEAIMRGVEPPPVVPYSPPPQRRIECRSPWRL